MYIIYLFSGRKNKAWWTCGLCLY